MWWKFPRAVVAGFVTSLLAAGALADDAPPSVDKLIERLASKDLNTRREAGYQLSHLGAAAKPALPALLKALDDDKQVWSYAIAAIAALGPDVPDAIPVLIDRLDGRKARGRRERDVRQGMMRTAYALSRMGPAAVPPLVEALGQSDDTLRAGAARALGGIGPAAHEAAPALLKNLSNNQDYVRDEVTQALALIGPGAGPALVVALHDSEVRRRAGAANALAQMDPAYRDGAKDLEQAASKETDPTVRAALFGALSKSGVAPDRCAVLILPAVTDENEAVRHAALNALLCGAVRQAAVPKLAALVKDNNPAVRERAARALGRIGPGAVDALPALLDAARAADGATAYADALAQIGAKALPALLDILQKSKPGEANGCSASSTAFGPPAVPVLNEALKSSSPEVRAAAANALGEMGHEASAAATPAVCLDQRCESRRAGGGFRALVAVHADSERFRPLLRYGLDQPDSRCPQGGRRGPRRARRCGGARSGRPGRFARR